MNHKTLRGTQRYTHTLQDKVRQNFAKVLNEGAILSGKQALTIKEKLSQNNPFRGKTVEQVDMLRKAMKIQIMSHGMCLQHPMRNEPCAGDGVCLGCHNFLTTPEFLPIHKGRLERVQQELAKAPGNGPYEAKLKFQEEYLIGIITNLENQMNYQGTQDNFTPRAEEG